jgi:putative tricarboxylic transport membrane protein
MLGALLIHNVVPGPTFIAEEPVLAYSIFIAFFLANFIMLGMQSVMLRVFVLVTKIRMYMLAAVILSLASIGVFALHNSTFDVWTLFWFGLLGFFMRQFGFPLAPMILGVVLGNVAELNLSRAFAITSDLSPFVTRPWSLFFLTIALFSAAFPYFQNARAAGAAWTRFYLPAVLIAVALPFVMMGGMIRPVIGGLCLAVGVTLIIRRMRAPEAKAGSVS